MLDLETLDTEPTAVVLTIGVVKFNPYTLHEPVEKKVWKPDIEAQLDSGRTTSDSTLEFWAKQPEEIRERAFSPDGRQPLAEIFAELNKYTAGVNALWAQHDKFDFGILENLYTQNNHHYNWQFYKINDTATVFNMMPSDPRKAVQQDLHDAGEDAYWQAVCTQKSFKHFGVKPR